MNLSTTSYRTHANDPILSKADMAHYFACYLFGREGCQAARAQFLADNFSIAATRDGAGVRTAAALALTPELEVLIPKEEREAAAATSKDGGHSGHDDAIRVTGTQPIAAATHLKRLLDEEVSPLFAQDLTGTILWVNGSYHMSGTIVYWI